MQTATEIIDALGGTGATARLANKSIQAVSNWRATNKLPADTFMVLRGELQNRGFDAVPAMWGMIEQREAS